MLAFFFFIIIIVFFVGFLRGFLGPLTQSASLAIGRSAFANVSEVKTSHLPHWYRKDDVFFFIAAASSTICNCTTLTRAYQGDAGERELVGVSLQERVLRWVMEIAMKMRFLVLWGKQIYDFLEVGSRRLLFTRNISISIVLRSLKFE